MKIGLLDHDSGNFPNLPLMKISAWHKQRGDTVEFINFLDHYDRVYVSKVFSTEYVPEDLTAINANEIIYGGTGLAISVQGTLEVYDKGKDPSLPYEVEHIYPDYGLYPNLTKNKAFGFLTRGCPNNCGFCIVSKKEGLKSVKVADLSEWWRGQKEIVLLDPNILACKDRINLLQQLADSGAKVDFTQGLDARLITVEIASLLKKIKVKRFHFAFDLMKNEKQILKGLKVFTEVCQPKRESCYVYVLTNYNTTFYEDFYRIQKIQEIGLDPDIRIYRKNALPKNHILKDLQRWVNNRTLYRAEPDFFNYKPRADGKTIKELYPEEYMEIMKGVKT